VYEYVCMSMCECVCVRERERECVCMSMCMCEHVCFLCVTIILYKSWNVSIKVSIVRF
jgi:hypothetical protein